MIKKASSMICIIGFFSTFSLICNVYAFEDDLAMIMPQVDLDMVVLKNSQIKTVTADLSFPMDFEIVPVTLIGDGRFQVTLTRPGTQGELVYFYLQVIKGFGSPNNVLEYGITPFNSLLTTVTISDDEEFNWAQVLIMHGILFSLEAPPYEYKLKLDFKDKPL